MAAKSKKFTLDLTAQEHARVEAAAAASGVRMATYVRALVLQAVVEGVYVTEGDDSKARARILLSGE